MCKTIKKLIGDNPFDPLEDISLIREKQHGFSSKRNCMKNLQDSFGKVINLYDHHKAVNVIYLDFQKPATMCCIVDCWLH